jgi:multiple sugar transport system ATP-binding protein
MQMGDKIVVMNHGSIEQFGVPQDIYDWPASKFVAQFLGSPPMNLLEFNGMVDIGAKQVRMGDITMDIPPSLEGANGALSFGIRPEHVKLDDSARYRGRVKAVEYLGTTQIVLLDTPNGVLKARLPSSDPVTIGATTGMIFDPRTITLFDSQTGKALRSQANQGVLTHG